MVNRTRPIIRNNFFIFILGILLGAILILAIRFAAYKLAGVVHYHANFAVYINGRQEQFKDAFYYQEIEAGCTTSINMTPHERAHMHDEVNNVVHVEDHAVTWGQFFQNIGWDVNPWFVKTPTQVLSADSSHPVTFMLNGKVEPNIVNQVIGDRDKLLVDYGDGSQNLQKEYKTIPSTAAQYDTSKDPASCGSSHVTTFHDRITHLF